MDFHALSSMPWIHLFASPACNLNCEYCTQHAVRTNKISDDFLKNNELLEFINRIPPTSIYLSGGEPLIHSGIEDFITIAGRCGHKIAIDTNISVSLKRLEYLLGRWDPEYFSFINISHHIICNISLDYIVDRAKLLKQAGIGNFVKYVGVPEFLGQIEMNIRMLKEQGIGATATILQGNWKGRTLPRDYTLDEAYRLCNLVSLNTWGLQIFDGIYSRTIPCRGGNDFITYNMHNNKKVFPCCHGSTFPLSLSESFFTTGERQRVPCKLKRCLGDLMFIFGVNGVTDEICEFQGLCHGKYELRNPGQIVKFVADVIDAGHPIVNISKYLEVSRNFVTYQRQQEVLKVSSSVSTPKKTVDSSLFKTKRGDDLIDELKSYINQWNSADEVIAANFEYASQLNSERKKLSISESALEARALAKKVLQYRFGLPSKCNIEAISTCILKCEFCILRDLKKYRRKVRMTYDDFLKIWRYMEPFTTEVEFTGGEPLLNKDVFSMIAEARRTDVFTTLTTNAQLLDQKTCNKILDAAPSRILIAYDGVDADTYESLRVKADFGCLKNNIKYLCSQKRERALEYPKVDLQMVVNRRNVDDIISYWQDAVDLGADCALLKPLFVWPNSDLQTRQKMIDEYLIPRNSLSYHDVSEQGELMDTRRPGVCPNVQKVHIGSGSEVIPCWYRLQETYKAGYCAERPFIDIWFSEEYVEYRRRMQQEEVAEGCRRCIGIYKPRLFIKKEVDELRKSSQLRRLCLEAEEFMTNELYDRALEKLNQAAQIQPRLPGLHYARAFALANSGQKNNNSLLSAIQSELVTKHPHEAAIKLLDQFAKNNKAGIPEEIPIVSDGFEILGVPFLNAVVANPEIAESIRIINKHLSSGDCVQANHIIESHLGSLPASSVVLSQMTRGKESGTGCKDMTTANIYKHTLNRLAEPQRMTEMRDDALVTRSVGIESFESRLQDERCVGSAAQKFVRRGRVCQSASGRQQPTSTVCVAEPKMLVKPQQENSITIPSIPIQELHKELCFRTPIDYPESSLHKPLEKWKMEVDDSPIFRYIYHNFRPKRHLEFGTWQGQGALYCLEECDATVWTINLLKGERWSDGRPAYALGGHDLAAVQNWAKKMGLEPQDGPQTDRLGYIGRLYLEKGLGKRVCQIYCDSTEWDISNYPSGFFDTVLIDGGHQADIVIPDTAKAFKLVRSGGLIMWHDFCPPIYDKFPATRGVMEAIHTSWEWINQQTSKLFWIHPSQILLGVKK